MKTKRIKRQLYFTQRQHQSGQFREMMACCIIIPSVVVFILIMSISEPRKTSAAVAVYPDSVQTTLSK